MRTCQQVAEAWAWGCPLTTPVGTELISTLPYLMLRQEEMAGSSGRAQLTVEVRIGRALKRVLCETLGPVKTTRFPLGVHFAVETQMLVCVGKADRAWFITLTRAGAMTESV